MRWWFLGSKIGCLVDVMCPFDVASLVSSQLSVLLFLCLFMYSLFHSHSLKMFPLLLPGCLVSSLLFFCCLMYTFYSFCWCNHWMISSSVSVSPQGYGCNLSPNLLLNVGITVSCNKKVAKKLDDVKGHWSLRWLLWLWTYVVFEVVVVVTEEETNEKESMFWALWMELTVVIKQNSPLW